MSGVLIFVGVDGFISTQLFARLATFCTSDAALMKHEQWGGIRPATLRMFTLAQFACYLGCAAFFVTAQVTGLAVDLAVGFVVCLVVQPIRDYFIKPMLTSEELEALDSLALPALQEKSDKPTENTPLQPKV